MGNTKRALKTHKNGALKWHLEENRSRLVLAQNSHCTNPLQTQQKRPNGIKIASALTTWQNKRKQKKNKITNSKQFFEEIKNTAHWV